MPNGTLTDFLRRFDSAEILCARKGEVMRKITRLPDSKVRIEAANGEALEVPGDTPLVYQPWCLDRGSILFNGRFKLCTEYDRVRYPNGTERLAEATDCAEQITEEPATW